MESEHNLAESFYSDMFRDTIAEQERRNLVQVPVLYFGSFSCSAPFSSTIVQYCLFTFNNNSDNKEFCKGRV
jgi:hypothetical protein